MAMKSASSGPIQQQSPWRTGCCRGPSAESAQTAQILQFLNIYKIVII